MKLAVTNLGNKEETSPPIDSDGVINAQINFAEELENLDLGIQDFGYTRCRLEEGLWVGK